MINLSCPVCFTVLLMELFTSNVTFTLIFPFYFLNCYLFSKYVNNCDVYNTLVIQRVFQMLVPAWSCPYTRPESAQVLPGVLQGPLSLSQDTVSIISSLPVCSTRQGLASGASVSPWKHRAPWDPLSTQAYAAELNREFVVHSIRGEREFAYDFVFQETLYLTSLTLVLQNSDTAAFKDLEC